MRSTSLKHAAQRQVWMKCPADRSACNWGNHEPISPRVLQTWHGSLFGMFREPSRRFWSAYAFFNKSSELFQPEEYAKRIQGGQTLMLSGQRYGLDCLSLQYPCETMLPNLPLALKALASFAFVGITDEWERSICLFHVRFGGPCLHVEFDNTRPTGPAKLSAQSAAKDKYHGELPVPDPFDQAVFAAVKARFLQEVAEHDVTDERCRAMCGAAWK